MERVRRLTRRRRLEKVVAALEARVEGGLRRLEALAAVVREGRRARIAATGSVELSCGSLVLWTAAGGSDESVGLSSRKLRSLTCCRRRQLHACFGCRPHSCNIREKGCRAWSACAANSGRLVLAFATGAGGRSKKVEQKYEMWGPALQVEVAAC